MGLKGNLLYNGDFETGTTEGWECGPFDLLCECDFSASADAKLRGNYGGYLKANVSNADAYIAYDKVCSFEEYGGYLFILPVKMVSGLRVSGMLYGLDDKGLIIDKYDLGLVNETGVWRTIIALLRGYKSITHFKVGLWYWANDVGEECYFDEVKLLPLRNVKSHVLKQYRFFDNVTADKTWYSVLACIGRCRLRSVMEVCSVSGTDPTLDTQLSIYMFEGAGKPYTLTHSQFTADDFEEKTIDLPEISIIQISYTVGGTDPSFDIYHHLFIEPVGDVSDGGFVLT